MNGGRLQLARHIRGWSTSELAARAHVSPSSVSTYERGASPSRDALARLAEALEFPQAYFLVDDNLSPPASATFQYRALARTRAVDRRRVEALAIFFDHLVGSLEANQRVPVPVPFSVSTGGDDPAGGEMAARDVREHLGLGDVPVVDMVALAERLDVWVHQVDADTADIDGVSFTFNGRRHMFLNTAKGDAFRSRFDCGHELLHVLAKEHQDREPSRALENQAHRFASALLVPAEAWRSEAPRSVNPRDYLPAKARWRMSVAALIRRSRDLSILSESDYTTANVRLSTMWGRRAEPDPIALPRERPHRLHDLLSTAAARGMTLDSARRELHLPEWVLAMVLRA